MLRPPYLLVQAQQAEHIWRPTLPRLWRCSRPQTTAAGCSPTCATCQVRVRRRWGRRQGSHALHTATDVAMSAAIARSPCLVGMQQAQMGVATLFKSAITALCSRGRRGAAARAVQRAAGAAAGRRQRDRTDTEAPRPGVSCRNSQRRAAAGRRAGRRRQRPDGSGTAAKRGTRSGARRLAADGAGHRQAGAAAQGGAWLTFDARACPSTP